MLGYVVPTPEPCAALEGVTYGTASGLCMTAEAQEAAGLGTATAPTELAAEEYLLVLGACKLRSRESRKNRFRCTTVRGLRLLLKVDSACKNNPSLRLSVGSAGPCCPTDLREQLRPIRDVNAPARFLSQARNRHMNTYGLRTRGVHHYRSKQMCTVAKSWFAKNHSLPMTLSVLERTSPTLLRREW